MDFKLETEFSKADILQEVDALKKQIDDKRPLSQEIEGRVMQKLRLDWNYNSNAIEGNKLNYGETTALLMHGITAKGKPLKDHLDIQGHNDAINFLQSIVKEARPFSEADIRELHTITLVEPYTVNAQTDNGKSTTKRIKLGIYKTSPNHVKTITGELHYYATPEETAAKMQELMEWYYAISKDKAVHPVVIAGLFHHKFTEIHPFDDGNGRLARILMNLILMKNGYPPVVIKMDDRQNYYSLLSRADVGEDFPFVEYVSERLLSSLRIYVKGINGEDIDEDEDIDKEIALFKMELQSEMSSGKEGSSRWIYNLCKEQLLPLIVTLVKKTSSFDDFFYRKSIILTVKYIDLVESSRLSHPIDLNARNLSQTFDFFNSDEYKIYSMQLEIKFNKFKSEDNSFDITETLKFVFSEYEYLITGENFEISTMKAYREDLTTDDKRYITAGIVRKIKKMIEDNFHQKSPKSNRSGL